MRLRSGAVNGFVLAVLGPVELIPIRRLMPVRCELSGGSIRLMRDARGPGELAHRSGLPEPQGYGRLRVFVGSGGETRTHNQRINGAVRRHAGTGRKPRNVYATGASGMVASG